MPASKRVIKSKLTQHIEDKQTSDSPTSEPKPVKTGAVKPTSFRLQPDDKAQLTIMVMRLRKATGRKISETTVIRALISIGSKATDERLIKEIKTLL